MRKENPLFYEPVHTLADVRMLVKEILKDEATKVERINFGEVNAVYSIGIRNNNEFVLKVSPSTKGENHLLQEAWAFGKCRTVGVPVPEVVSVDTSLSKFPEAYLLTKKINGTPGSELELKDDEYLGLIRQVGHYLYLIHSVSVEGFGEIVEDKKQFRGEYDTLWESVISVFSNSKWMDVINSHGILTKSDLNRYQRMLIGHKDLFELERASLTHGDIGPRNLIMEGNKIVGIVDMENVLATDPIRDFHWFGYWIEGSQRLKALQDGYDNKKLFDDNFVTKMKLCQIVHSLPALAYYQNRNNIPALNYLREKVYQADRFLQSQD